MYLKLYLVIKRDLDNPHIEIVCHTFDKKEAEQEYWAWVADYDLDPTVEIYLKSVELED